MSCLGKLFLSIINNRITEFVSDKNILSSGQLGFWKLNRTSDPHIILNNICQKYCHQRGKIYMDASLISVKPLIAFHEIFLCQN